MIRILHFSDLHLDHSFADVGLPSTVGAWLRDDLRATLVRILSLARQYQVDAITIAGDLFEQTYVVPDTAHFLAEQFARLSPIRIFIAPGEHDPYTNHSLYALTSWPQNVTIFIQERLQAVELVPGIFIWGTTYPLINQQQIFKDFHINKPGANLLLLHTNLTDSEQTTSTFQITPTVIGAAGFDYALLGGKHVTWTWPAEAAFVVYTGSPEPLTFAENSGNHHISLLTIEEGRYVSQLQQISQWRWYKIDVDITDCKSERQTISKIVHTLETQAEGLHERSLCHVNLIGKPAFYLSLSGLAERLDTRAAHIRIESRLSHNYNLAQLAQEQTIRGLLIRHMQERLANCATEQERHRQEQALFVALKALNGEQVHPYEVI